MLMRIKQMSTCLSQNEKKTKPNKLSANTSGQKNLSHSKETEPNPQVQNM